MREGAVRLRHPVCVLFLLDRLALTFRGENQLGGQPLRHVFFAAGAAGPEEPPPAPRGGAVRAGLPPALLRGGAPPPGRSLPTRAPPGKSRPCDDVGPPARAARPSR